MELDAAALKAAALNIDTHLKDMHFSSEQTPPREFESGAELNTLRF